MTRRPAFLFTLAGAVLVIGFSIAWQVGTSRLTGRSDMQFAAVPGRTVLQLDPGDWILFHEYEGVMDEEYYFVDPEPENLEIQLIDAATSRPLPLAPADDVEPYRLGSRKGRPLFTLPLDRPATLTLVARYEGDGPPSVLAVGSRQVLDIRRRIVSSQIIVLITSILGGVLLIAALLGLKGNGSQG